MAPVVPRVGVGRAEGGAKSGRGVSSWWQERGSQGWAFPSDPAEVTEARMRGGKVLTVLGPQLPSCSDMGFVPERGERISVQLWAQRRGSGVSDQVPVVSFLGNLGAVSLYPFPSG